MRVAIFGAAGKTGGLLVDRALAKGYEVTVLVRNASKFKKEGVRVVAGDATKLDDVLHAVRGQDAVIDAIGGSTPYKMTLLESTSVHNMIDAMKGGTCSKTDRHFDDGHRRKQGSSAFLVQAPADADLSARIDKGQNHDGRRGTRSGLNYVIARPPILKDDPPTGAATVIGTNTTGHAITRADLASFLVDQLEAD